MIRAARTVALAILLAGSTGIAAAPPKQEKVEPPQTAAPDPGVVTLLGRYRGTLPCADCSGIRTELSLYGETAVGAPAGFLLRETYLGVPGGERTVESAGRWRIVQGTPADAEALVYQLAYDRPESTRSFRRVDARTLRLLDRSLGEISSGAAYVLVREDAAASASGAPVTAPPAEKRGETPRSAIIGYLLASRAGEDDVAATYLDLSAIPESERAERGPTLARHLKIVLDQTLWFGDLDDVSDVAEGRLDDGLPPDRDRVGAIRTAGGTVDVRLKRVQEPDGSQRWKFSPGLVERIPALYDEFGMGVMGDWLPRWAYGTRFAEVELWQWLAFPILIVLALALSWIVAPLAFRLLSHGTKRTRTATDDRLLEASSRPLQVLLVLLLLLAGLGALHLSIPAARVVSEILRVLFVLLGTWWVLRLIDALAESARLKLLAEGRASAIGAVTLGRRLVKVAVCLLALVVVLQQTDFRVSGLLAGIGVGGLAAGLGAQRSVANLLGGITLAMDQAFRVGDLCRVGDVYGTVEEIGFRSTRIRTLDRTVVTVPNSQMSDSRIENYAMRDSIRLLSTLSLRSDTTADQVRAVASGIRELLAGHPKVSRSSTQRVRLVGVADGSLALEIMAYVATTELNEFMEIREEILLRVVEIVRASGATLSAPAVVAAPSRPPGSPV